MREKWGKRKDKFLMKIVKNPLYCLTFSNKGSIFSKEETYIFDQIIVEKLGNFRQRKNANFCNWELFLY